MRLDKKLKNKLLLKQLLEALKELMSSARR